jgi:hypothetical protein
MTQAEHADPQARDELPYERKTHRRYTLEHVLEVAYLLEGWCPTTAPKRRHHARWRQQRRAVRRRSHKLRQESDDSSKEGRVINQQVQVKVQNLEEPASKVP